MTDNSLDQPEPVPPRASRRGFLQAAGAAGIAAASFGLVGARTGGVAADEPLKLVRVGWAEPAACHSPIAFADHAGIFAKHGIKVELVNFLNGGDDLLVQLISTGKIDVGIGLLLTWLKPLGEGLNVKLISATHAGCMRLLVNPAGSVKSVQDLRGKTIAVAGLAGAPRDTFAVALAKAGIDPETDVTWKVFPGDLLSAAVQKGEADALAHLDPQTYGWIKDDHLLEIANSQTGVFAGRSCCVVGANDAFLGRDKKLVRALVEAVIEAHEYTANHPAEVAHYYKETYKPPVSEEELAELLGVLLYHHHPAGKALEKEVALSIDDLKLLKVFKPDVDSAALAKKFTANVFA